MEPPIQREPSQKTGRSKFVAALIVIGACLFVTAGAIAVYAAVKNMQTVDQTIKDLGQD